MYQSQVTFGILYPGELGRALGVALASHGLRVVTTTLGRSQRTTSACEKTPLEVLPSLHAVKESADVIVSVVPPTAACEVAEAYHCSQAKAPERVLYVDANSVSPETVKQVQNIVETKNVDVVDAAVHGLASQLTMRGTLYLSGPRADELGGWFRDSMRVQTVGPVVGEASFLKMMLGGISKGLVGLFVELALVSRKAGVYEHFFSELCHYYPGIRDAIERLVPTYPLHATRRGTELREIGCTMRAHASDPMMIAAAEKIIAGLGMMDLQSKQLPGYRWSVADVIEQASEANMELETEQSFAAKSELDRSGAPLSQAAAVLPKINTTRRT